MPTKPARAIPVSIAQQIRCAIYTRKSTEEGLEQEFNSLDAQRGSSKSYIQSQRQLGWAVVPEQYDDGGFTGANIDRPALKKLLSDVELGRVDCIVVYKVDRLTRSIRDLMHLLTILDENKVTLVSVTESFNTTTPAGRMTLNLLLTFAQYERELIAERTRDKMRAARREGRWIGGNLVLGYDLAPQGGALVVNPAEAEGVREIFSLYLELGSMIPVIEELDRRKSRMKAWTTREGRKRGGAQFNKTTLHNLLTNVTYTGRVKFEEKLLPGEHERIIDDETWNRVQEQLNRNGRRGGRNVRNSYGGLLKGLVRCQSCGSGMTHTYVKKGQKIYRYYVCNTARQRGWNTCQTRSVSAPMLEGAVRAQLRGLASQPEMLAEVLVRLRENCNDSIDRPVSLVDPEDVRQALLQFDPLWEQLTTWEQERFIRVLVVEVKYDGPTQTVTVGFRSERIKELCNGERAGNE